MFFLSYGVFRCFDLIDEEPDGSGHEFVVVLSFVFRRDDEASEPEFYCLMTFGAGKGDKPTFGYDKSVFPNYMMLEGCDNGRPLLECRVPWNEDVVRDDSSGDVLWLYNGEKNLELSLGSEAKADFFRDAFNFTYLHSIMIKPFIGKLSALKADKTLSTSYQYWVTAAEGESQRYDLYRYDFITQTWVDAGIEKKAEGVYERLNINEQCDSAAGSSGYWEDINEAFIASRTSAFKAGIGVYYYLKDILFTVCFCKLIAASDNRAIT